MYLYTYLDTCTLVYVYMYISSYFFLPFTKKSSSWTAWLWDQLASYLQHPFQETDTKMSIYYMPSPCLIGLHTWNCLVLTTLKNRYCYYIHFSDEDIITAGEAVCSGSHSQWQSLILNPGNQISEPHILNLFSAQVAICSCIILFSKHLLSNYYVLGSMTNPRDTEIKEGKI